MKTLRAFFRFFATLAVTGVAVWLGYLLWQHYLDSPWTRDGVVQAHIADIAADVPGRVVRLDAHDNELVHRGQPLFRIDPERYRIALQAARERLEKAREQLQLRRTQADRRAMLGPDAVAGEHREDSLLEERVAQAAYREAAAAVRLARLNLRRTLVRAPAAGYVTSLQLRKGDYARTGIPQIALVEQHSFWVYGYFEQTRLSGVKIGDPAEITLLGQKSRLEGRVEGIAAAVADRESHRGNRLVASVRPAFNWVRLAARVPVRVQILRIPKGVHIAAGMICTVVVKPPEKKGRHAGCPHPKT